MSAITSASITRSDDFERSWLRSSRTVSWFVSSSSLPPATKPATSTRWNADTSSLALIGVSIGTSYSSLPHAIASTAQPAARPPSTRLRLVFLLSRAVIDFFEELVVLTDLRIVRLERQRLLVGLARLVELPFVFVGNGQVVERRGVGRIELDGLFPSGRSPRATGRAGPRSRRNRPATWRPAARRRTTATPRVPLRQRARR